MRRSRCRYRLRSGRLTILHHGESMDHQAKARQSILSLNRPGTLTDVVDGIVLWRLFVLIPKPGEVDLA